MYNCSSILNSLCYMCGWIWTTFHLCLQRQMCRGLSTWWQQSDRHVHLQVFTYIRRVSVGVCIWMCMDTCMLSCLTALIWPMLMNVCNVADTEWHQDKKKTLFSPNASISGPLNSPMYPAACLLVMYQTSGWWTRMLIIS